jgi:benzoyl-CoA reductase/2-hydroxyglutaryl-CoA dehydratase subunit BcrC/BadD/HgdB
MTGGDDRDVGMSGCCRTPGPVDPGDPCHPPSPDDGGGPSLPGAMARFNDMIGNCLAYAEAARSAGRKIVGIMCEYTPREVIMAAGAVPVCLCGGSAETALRAEDELPANLCPLIKSTYGYHLEGSNPFLEMADLIVAETTCDGKKKMFELLARRRPMHVLELPQMPDRPAAATHWLSELHHLIGVLAQRFGVTITDDGLRAAIRAMNRERALRRELAALMRADRPPLTGRQLIALKSSISCIPDDLVAYAAILNELRHHPTGGCRTDDPVRVLLTGVPLPCGAERVLDLLEGCGGLVVAQENCTGLKPILDDIDATATDPLAVIAAKYLHLPCSVMTANDGRRDLLRRLVAEYRPDCVVELVWQACLTYDLEAVRIRDLCERELGLPYLKITTDYQPADSARIAVRIEALYETVRASTGA